MKKYSIDAIIFLVVRCFFSFLPNSCSRKAMVAPIADFAWCDWETDHTFFMLLQKYGGVIERLCRYRD